MFKRRAFNAAHAESGLAILEFALVAVFALLIGTAGLEFAQSLRLLESATTLSRELASSAYRNCAGGVASDHDGYPFDFYGSCVEESISNVLAGMAAVLPGSAVVVSIYEFAPVPGTTAPSSFARRGEYAAGGQPSRFAVSADGKEIIGSVQSKQLESHRWTVIAEVYVPYGQKSPLLHIFRPKFFYDATIM